MISLSLSAFHVTSQQLPLCWLSVVVSAASMLGV